MLGVREPESGGDEEEAEEMGAEEEREGVRLENVFVRQGSEQEREAARQRECETDTLLVNWNLVKQANALSITDHVLCCWSTLCDRDMALCTFISAFTVLCGAHSELVAQRGVCCVFLLNVAAALIQILTAFIMVGWIMSIFWGMDMVILASCRDQGLPQDV
ncbi:unnamed protein product [Merluccius merluccius]